MNTKPFNNNVLIEIIREDDGVSRTDENETKNRGKLLDYSIASHHLTASSALEFSSIFISDQKVLLDKCIGKIVRWEEFAEGGQTFEENGKNYALIPFWRIIAVEGL